jgi:hypothetical protein
LTAPPGCKTDFAFLIYQLTVPSSKWRAVTLLPPGVESLVKYHARLLCLIKTPAANTPAATDARPKPA